VEENVADACSDRGGIKSFVVECACFVALQAALFVGLEIAYTRLHLRGHYLTAWNDKQARLQTVPPPRVLLVGGSSWAFGVLSPMLEEGLGRPVVNLGLHAGMGREFILREAAAAVRPGDVVVLSLEYPLLAPRDSADLPMLMDLVECAPPAAQFIPLRLIPDALDCALQHLTKRPRALALDLIGRSAGSGGVYSRSAFNGHGDVVAHYDRGSLFGMKRHGGLPVPADAVRPVVARLNRFAEQVRAAGGLAFFSLPPLPEDDRRRQAERLDALALLLRAELQLPVIEPQVAGLPRSFFYDTAYHLTREGAERRTRELIMYLRQALLAAQAGTHSGAYESPGQ